MAIDRLTPVGTRHDRVSSANDLSRRGFLQVGAAAGGVGGHLWRGMSRSDVKELGDIIDAGQAALVIVGESKVEQALEKAGLKAEKHVAKELDVSPKDIDQAVQEAAGEVS